MIDARHDAYLSDTRRYDELLDGFGGGERALAPASRTDAGGRLPIGPRLLRDRVMPWRIGRSSSGFPRTCWAIWACATTVYI